MPAKGKHSLLAARLLLLGALAGDGWLAWHSLNGTLIAGCGGAGGCSAVLASKWAYWFGVPVSIPAIAIHLCLFCLTLVPFGKGGPILKFRERATLGLAVLVWLSALWFVVIMAWVIGGYCPFCLAAHGFSALAAFLILKDARRNAQTRIEVSGALLGLAAFCVLPLGQMLFPKILVDIHPTPPPPASLSGPTRASVVLGAGIGEVRPRDFPFLGNPDSNLVAALVFDFTCAHCRKSHDALKRFVAENSDAVCVLLLPASLEPACNPYIANLLPEHVGACDYARLAVAMWRNSPEDFHAFCGKFLKADPAPPPVAEAKAWAEARIGRDRLAEILLHPDVQRTVARNIEVFASAVRASGRLEMPKLITRDAVISGAADTPQAYRTLLKPD